MADDAKLQVKSVWIKAVSWLNPAIKSYSSNQSEKLSIAAAAMHESSQTCGRGYFCSEENNQVPVKAQQQRLMNAAAASTAVALQQTQQATSHLSVPSVFAHELVSPL